MTIKRSVCILLATFLWLSLASSVRADRSYLQPESIRLGDIAEFVIEYDKSIPSLYALDTNELEKDFELLQKDSRVIRLDKNGDNSHRMQWRLQITPRRSGRLQVPAIRYGNDWTSPVILEVMPAASDVQSAGQVFVELNSPTPQPYLGQQTTLKSRFYSSAPFTRPFIEAPRAGELSLQRSRPDKSYREQRQAKDYRVLEQEYVLFPRQPGRLQILPAGYRVTITDTDGRRRVIRRSESMQLEVKPPPTSYAGKFWLPATDLQLSQRWGTSKEQLRVGDSLDWTLTMVARGLPAESLPTDLLARGDGSIRIYADQAVLSNRFEDGHIIGHVEQRYAIVAASPGRFELPSLRLKWWNVVDDRQAEARLDGRVFQVGAAGTGPETGIGEGGTLDSLRPVFGLQTMPLVILISSLLLAIVAIPAYAPLKSRLEAKIEAVSQRRRVRQKLQAACLCNEAVTAREALIEWARQRWPREPIVGLRQIGDRLDSASLCRQLADLDRALFAREAVTWRRGPDLWRALENLLPEKRGRRSGVPGLPGLYPGRV